MFDLNSLFFLFLILCAAGVGLAVLLPRQPKPGGFGLDRVLVFFDHLINER